ncbi:MAG: ABC transporter permease [Gammaproteobacteria bacterium]|nr:ABC transporter permease [Gammaproteobacteria bacterium]
MSQLSQYEHKATDFGNPNWVAFQTIVRTEIRRFTRIWIQTLIPPAITMTLYFIIFGSLIGQRIGTMNGFDYMAYIVPGLIMMSVITNAYANVSSSFFGAKFGKFIEEMLVSPISYQTILLGYIVGGVARALAVAVIVTGLSLFFTDLEVHNVFAVISIALLTAVLFSILGFVNGVYAKRFDDVSIVPTFVLTPLTYLGGVFFSIELLPSFWAGLAQLNPILYVVNAFRFGILGVSDISIGWAYAILMTLTLVSYLIALRLLKQGAGVRS